MRKPTGGASFLSRQQVPVTKSTVTASFASPTDNDIFPESGDGAPANHGKAGSVPILKNQRII